MNTVTKNRAPLVRFFDVYFSWTNPPANKKSDMWFSPMFDSFTADIPPGFISLVGPNGSGKSTFMLLAGGRILPSHGKIELCGYDTRVLSGHWKNYTGEKGPGLTEKVEHQRNLVCSFLFQNMEFILDEDITVKALLEFVYENGGHYSKDDVFFRLVLSALELEKLLNRRPDELSKGENQRVLLAFSALYGSKVIMMDEPVFAMEQYQKEKALDFFRDLYRNTDVSIVISLHELSLTRKYADTVMLFYPDHRIDLGTPEEVLTREALETAYGVPVSMLYDTEKYTRNVIFEQGKYGV
ncbi:ABC transporter ATP-binding protein [Brucepastera parasyntrophica]|uniref:ATP-binding cassette domain-containing protein n=1 Tax=Brucepastera parasyntrophica TaxID=2880008 RepID=UPI002109605E|nr:ABC transporter ATP-binding protein [Brucepastera parasyntrophica]ULQ58968.1 ABC transporter ATP-binding protein [Brucepastera parasyntrophica]